MLDENVMDNQKVYIVTVSDEIGNQHVIEVFTNEQTSLDYIEDMTKLYPPKDGWMLGYGLRTLDQEHIGLTGNNDHVRKVFDSEWTTKYNTIMDGLDLEDLKEKLREEQ